MIVIVENSDDEPPDFTSSSTFRVKEEDSYLVDQVVFTVTAVNRDSVNGMDGIRYGISGSGVEDVFSINPATGEITLLREIDRETPGEDEFVLLVSATEEASDLTSVEQLFVTVEDENDHEPEFRETRRTFVTENAPKGEQFGEVTAFDADLDDAPSNFGTIVEYRKLDNVGTCGNLFSVTQNGGIVVETLFLDRETEPELNQKLVNYSIRVSVSGDNCFSTRRKKFTVFKRFLAANCRIFGTEISDLNSIEAAIL